jgi:hypothetical protein
MQECRVRPCISNKGGFAVRSLLSRPRSPRAIFEALGSQWSGLQRVDHEAVKQIMVACEIIGLTHLPEREQMASVRASRRFVDDRVAGMERAAFGINIRWR